MKFRKVLLVLAVPFLLDVASSCSMGCDVETYQYVHKDLQVANLDNSGAKAVVTSGEVKRSAYGIRLSISRDAIAAILHEPGLSFSTKLYASDCIENEYIAKDSITSIKVVSLVNFDEEHGAGSDVSDYFKVGLTGAFTALDDYVNMYGHQTLNLNGPIQAHEINLLLMTQPEPGTYQFKLEVTISDGRNFEGTTNEIELVE
ncbi:DUF5034 domain-containing protein [Pseudochryseolinea flava]|uniref:DUF5034 domain-containing protein n=1 Tax=Pseudochryseolinea flava TaxID=2059302 RepID=A0A364Y0X7_9BACT|nr:DUF5034 domain-containing protein [Pseudochryseolinea flava]RAW00349.1 hypothetical protein DQQ10_14950 [Pseudochryseolinea flava]